MKKILIAEDNDKNLRLFRLLLKGKPVLEARNGRQALDTALQDPPDVILLDIQLPELSGLDVMLELRKHERFKTTPIIALTAHAMKGDRERFLASGFSGYIAKPVDTRAFVAQIEEIAGGL